VRVVNRWLKTGRLPIPCAAIGFALCVLIGCERFMKIEVRTKSSECRSNLKSLFTTEKAYFAEQNRYTTHLNDLEFEPERGNRYAYFLGRNGPMEERTTSERPEVDRVHRAIGVDVLRYGGAGIHADQVPMSFRGIPVGLSGECPRCEFLAVCAGQLDSDPALDVWTISSQKRVGPDGNDVPAGTPVREINDERERAMPPLPPTIATNDD
jgi:type IV pilus assembly protein PilA